MYFEHWHDFYLLIGGAAATLMGLTFVAITLAPDVITGRVASAVPAFVTPIVAYFASVLIISLVVLVPQLTPATAGVFFSILGTSGLIYILRTGVIGQWRKWQLGIDDWIWYIGLPFLAYGTLLASAAGLWFDAMWSMNLAAAAASILLTTGIRNAWDVVLAIARHTKS